MNSNKTTALLLVVIVALVGVMAYRKYAIAPSVPNNTVGPVSGAPSASPDTADLVSLSIPPGAALHGTQTVTGSIKGAYFFEGQARGMLLGADKSVLKHFSITATSTWMTSDAVSFTATVDATGIPAGEGYFRIANDNPSGDAAKDKYIDVPVTFQ